MVFYHLLILALVQGVTEFLPISSSAHLILLPHFMGVVDQGLVMDIAVHVGTLLAVILYFRRDVGTLAVGSVDIIARKKTAASRLAFFVAVATIPVFIAGGLLHYYMPDGIRSAVIIAATSIVFGVLLGWFDKTKPETQSLDDLTLKQSFIIGLSQAVALIPGTSRSGITMTMARYFGFSRTEAGRYSLLLSIPTLMGAGAVGGYELWQTGSVALGADVGIAIALSFVSALLTIYVMMRWLRSFSFMPFVIYRILLGILILVLVAGGHLS